MVAKKSAYDKLEKFGNTLDYTAFVDTYVETRDQKQAIVAAGYAPSGKNDNSSVVAAGLMKKPAVHQAIMERAASKYFSSLPVAVGVLTQIMQDEKAHPSLRAKVAMHMIDKVEVRELAKFAAEQKKANNDVNLEDLAKQLAATGAFENIIAGAAITVEPTGDEVSSEGSN